MNCMVCHATDKNDLSVKTGPNLYGVFATEPHAVEVFLPAKGKRKKVMPNEAYFQRAVRNPGGELVIAHDGPFKGQPYPAAMPAFLSEVVSDADLEALYHYVRSLGDPGMAGPSVVMIKKSRLGPAKSLLDIEDEVPVGDRPLVLRARVTGLSGRALFVGLPGQLNYGFDPRLLSVRRVWTGGFLNLREERRGRGGEASALGHQARVVLDDEALLAPLTKEGKRVDFEFKEPDAGDFNAIATHLNDPVDFMTRLKELDAEFLGHQLDVAGMPTFRFRVGRNQIEESIALNTDGELTIHLRAQLAEPQAFQLRSSGLQEVSVKGGTLADGRWSLPAAAGWQTFALQANLPLDVAPLLPVGAQENLKQQPLVTAPAAGERMPIELPQGYRMVDWQAPLDPYGRKLMFEPTGIDVAKDGTIVLATRAAGVWRIRDGYWTRFAEGTFECLGVCIEDDKGDRVVIAQKPELTRLTDTNGDGLADRFDTVCDDYGFHSQYHEYTHGPARDAKGNYHFTLNLCHDPKHSWGGGSTVMGTMGGYRGWACRVTPDGRFEPYAAGVRSPAGIGVAPDGRVWYAENQGDFVGSSKMVPLEDGKFYGHVAALTDLPGMTPQSPELTHEKWKDKLRKGALWFPHRRLANSPGNPVWDLTGGRFGAYSGQMFIADQTLSTILRVVTEQVDGIDQGCVMPFGSGLASGGMRPVFLPDGSLLIGQTGRGWGAKGGHQYALQQIIWDGKTVVADLSKMSASKQGFTLHFTQALKEGLDEAELCKQVEIESWFYINSPSYGSPEADKRGDAVASVTLSPDRRQLSVALKDFGQGERWLDRIYHLQFKGAATCFGEPVRANEFEAYATLRAIPR